MIPCARRCASQRARSAGPAARLAAYAACYRGGGQESGGLGEMPDANFAKPAGPRGGANGGAGRRGKRGSKSRGGGWRRNEAMERGGQAERGGPGAAAKKEGRGGDRAGRRSGKRAGKGGRGSALQWTGDRR